MMESNGYRPGETIPGTQYAFVEALGEGGHGVCMLTEHAFLRSRFVLKTLHARLCDREDMSDRIRREAQVLAQFKHPNIVTVTDGGMTRERPPRPYFVMEHLEGMTLRQLISTNKTGVGVDAALRTMIPLFDALGYAHAMKMIHRDLKPENLFLQTARGGGTTPKILDFGIVKLLSGMRTMMTGSHALGTPIYMAPEQALGDPSGVKFDIYAMGLVLYELLLGNTPFDHCQSAPDVLAAKLTVDVPPLPDAFPKPLVELVAAMTARDAEKRSGDAMKIAARLKEILQKHDSSSAPGEAPAFPAATARSLSPIPMKARPPSKRISSGQICLFLVAMGIFGSGVSALGVLLLARTEAPASASAVSSPIAVAAPAESTVNAIEPSATSGPTPAIEPKDAGEGAAIRDAGVDAAKPARAAPAFRGDRAPRSLPPPQPPLPPDDLRRFLIHSAEAPTP